MPSNPFAPPQAARVEVPVRRPRKPLGVWVAQGLLLLMACLVAGDLAKSVLARIGPQPIVWSRQPIVVALDAFVVVWLAAAMIGAEFRQGFARWLGVAIALLVSGMVSWFCLFVDPLGKPSEAMLDYGIAALAVVLGFAIGWGFAFSAKAKVWFRVGPGNRGSDGIA